MNLFRDKGFDNTTIREIAEAAKVSQRTFFRYFTSKEEVVFSRPAEEFEVLRSLLVERLATQDPFPSLKSAAFEYAKHLEQQQDEIRLRARLVAESGSLRRRAALEVQSWVERLAGEIAAVSGEEVQARHVLLTSVVLSAVTLAATSWGNDDNRSLVDVLQELLDELAEVL